MNGFRFYGPRKLRIIAKIDLTLQTLMRNGVNAKMALKYSGVKIKTKTTNGKTEWNPWFHDKTTKQLTGINSELRRYL